MARTKPRREAAAAAILAQRDVEVYLPLMTVRRRSETKSAAMEPLFPGYLFARLDVDTETWLAARSAPGVAYFLGSELAPSPLPDELIEAIRDRADQYALKQRIIPFRQGDAVIIKRGAFSGLEAVFDGCLSGKGRVRVLLETLERFVPVTLDVHLIEKAPRMGSVLSAVG